MRSDEVSSRSWREVERDREYVRRIPVGQRTEGPGVARGFHRPLRVQVEGEVARRPGEPDLAHAAVPQNQETDLGLERCCPGRPIPPTIHLRHDVPQIL